MEAYKIEQLSKQYGMKTVFENITLSISEGDKIALVGINGTGKSALLKCIAGLEDHNGIVTHPKHYSIEYAAQQPVLDDSRTITENVMDEHHPAMQLFKRYNAILEQMNGDVTDELLDELSTVQNELDAIDAYSYRADAERILTKLGITDLDSGTKELSGGQKKRVALARSLLKNADLLLLDEPTNHLDFESIQWLIQYIKAYRKSVLVVSHDRYFLNEITDRIIELSHGKINLYTGNYNDYVEQKAEMETIQANKEQKERQLYKSELAWMRAGAKARTTKQQARIDRFSDIEDKLKSHHKKETMEINLNNQRLGKQVFEIESISKSFDQHVLFKDFSQIVQTSDRIGITGENGTGKSTLLNILAGMETMDNGMIKTGQTVKIGYYRQMDAAIEGNMRVIDYLREKGEEAVTKSGEKISVTQLLERFLFPSSVHGTQIDRLSGGERKRLYLLSILIEGPNVLLLDEPTNDFDTTTLTILEQYLEEFNGAVITVSHDRYFLNKVVSKYWYIKNETIHTVLGQFEDLLSYQKALPGIEKQEAEAQLIKDQESVKENNNHDNKKSRQKLSYKEKRRFEFLSEEIEKLELEMERIDTEISGMTTNYEALAELTKKREDAEAQYEAYFIEWNELSERME